MTAMIDYLGSLFVGGMVLMMMTGFYTSIGQTAASQVFDSIVQEDLTSVAQVVEYDFRKMGYQTADSVNVLAADTSSITFKADFNNDGAVETMRYYLGPQNVSAPASPRILYRSYNSQPAVAFNSEVLSFRLTYFDINGNTTSTLRNIRSVKIAMNLQNTSPVDSVYAGAYWERTITPKNWR